MKTTVHTGKNTRFVVETLPGGLSIRQELRSLYKRDAWSLFALITLTPDQAGALIFGMEQALEVGEFAAMRATVACPHARICDQEGECAYGCTQRLGAPA